MRLATFNLESLDMPPKASVPLEQRIELLRPQLDRLAADILCLQEVNGQRPKGGRERRLLALERLLETTPYADYARACTTGPEGKGVADVHNLVILSRFPILETQQVRHDLVQAPSYRRATAKPQDAAAVDVGWDRPILQATVELPGGRPLHVFNVHLRAPLAATVPGQKSAPFVWKSTTGWAEGYFLAAIKRTGQALELRLAVDRILDANAKALIAVCGDLNAEDHDTPLRIVIAAEEDTGSGALAARAMVPLERSLAKERRFTVLHHGRPQMLDHILVSRQLLGHFQALKIHNETLEDELVGYAKVDRPPESFHAPVVAEFAVGEKGSG